MRRSKRSKKSSIINFSDELPFISNIFNFVCLLSILSVLVTLATYIIGGMPFISILMLIIMLTASISIFYISVKYPKLQEFVMVFFLCGLSLIFWPIIFFTNGGPNSGVATYFVLAIVLDLLLLKGKFRIGTIILTSATIIFCYISTLFFGWGLLDVDKLNTTQRFLDIIQSIFVVGFFLGSVIIFQNHIYLKERVKVQIAGEELLRNEKLLSLINESALRLLSTSSYDFKTALTEIMEKMAICLNVDSIFIWRNNELDGKSVYTIIHEWISPVVDRSKTFESLLGTKSIPRSADWDDRLLCEKGYLSELTKNFGDSIRSILSTSGIQAIMSFPVYYQGNYWGFVSFENRHSETLCSDSEASILQSGSLLLANSIQRNDTFLQLNDRLSQQQLMSDISKSFISKEAMDDLIKDALSKMGLFMNVDRIIIAVFEKKSEISKPAYFWFIDPKYAPNASQKGFSSVIRRLFPQYHNDNDNNPSIYCDNTLTYKDENFKIFFDQGGLKSFICTPIYIEGELWGVMSVESHKAFRNWSESDAMLVSTVCSSISNAVVRDIIEHERSEALDKAVQASRAKSDFLANMSHEIRTPMNAIIGMTTIGKSSNTVEKKDYAFDKIDNASKHLLGVINDILDMSKIEANKLELSDVSFEFEKMLQKVVNVINFRVDELRQKFYINIDKNMPRTFIGDDQRLAQVITNLLSNAVKFTPEEGTIRIEANFISEQDNMCCLQISVEDTGIGITDEQKSRLFMSFEQAETGTSRKFGGTGLRTFNI